MSWLHFPVWQYPETSSVAFPGNRIFSSHRLKVVLKLLSYFHSLTTVSLLLHSMLQQMKQKAFICLLPCSDIVNYFWTTTSSSFWFPTFLHILPFGYLPKHINSIEKEEVSKQVQQGRWECSLTINSLPRAVNGKVPKAVLMTSPTCMLSPEVQELSLQMGIFSAIGTGSFHHNGIWSRKGIDQRIRKPAREKDRRVRAAVDSTNATVLLMITDSLPATFCCMYFQLQCTVLGNGSVGPGMGLCHNLI